MKNTIARAIGRSPRGRYIVGAVLIALAAPLGFAATLTPPIAAPDQPNTLRLAYPPGNLVVRLNGMSAITGKVFPAIAQASHAFSRSVPQKTLYSGTAELRIANATVGYNVKTKLTELTLTVPVAADDWKASFAAADPQQARVQSTYDFNQASLNANFRIHTSPTGNVPANLPDPLNLLRFTRLDEKFSIKLSGFKGNLDVRLKKNGNSVSVDAVEQFSLSVSNVNVGDSGPLEEIANAVLGLNTLFRIGGGKVHDADTAATRLLNDLLRQDLGIEADIKKYANQALTSFDTQQFLNQEFNVASGVVIFVSPNLERLQSGPNWLVNEWAPGIDAKPDGRVPGLIPRAGATLTTLQPIGSEAAAGAAQVFVPYTLVEHVLYELIQAGLLRDIVVPSASNGGVGNGFAMHVVPTESPRLQRDPNDPQQMALDCAVRMDDTTVASVPFQPPSGPVPANTGPTLPATVDVVAVGATAAMRVFVKPRTSPTAGVYLEVTAVNLTNLSGELRVAMVKTNLAPYAPQLQNAITAALRSRAPQIGILPRAISVFPPLHVVSGTPTLGPVYIVLPLSVTD